MLGSDTDLQLKAQFQLKERSKKAEKKILNTKKRKKRILIRIKNWSQDIFYEWFWWKKWDTFLRKNQENNPIHLLKKKQRSKQKIWKTDISDHFFTWFFLMI